MDHHRRAPGLSDPCGTLDECADRAGGGIGAMTTSSRCGADECEGAVYARGLCGRHYKQLRRHGAVSADVAPTACAVPGCGRRAVTRGWCHGHYVRWSRGGDVQAERPLRRPVDETCDVEGCPRGRHSTSYCRTHANRLRRHGDVHAGGPIREHVGDGSLSHGYWYVAVGEDRSHLVPPGRRKEFEHRLVMAELLGRPLTADETVHHRSGDRLDNRPENLELWSTAQPKGQRVEDELAWARAFIARYESEGASRPPGDTTP